MTKQTQDQPGTIHQLRAAIKAHPGYPALVEANPEAAKLRFACKAELTSYARKLGIIK